MGDDGVPGGKRAAAAVNFMADCLGLTAERTWLRYALLFATLGSLALAAFLFGPDQLIGAAIALLLAFFVVVFVVVFWFFDERRKRRVTLGKEAPQKRDAVNPDFRDEAIAACLALFVLVPLALQTLNKSTLHFNVAPERVGLPSISCNAGAHASCEDVQRLVQLPSWVVFTLRSFMLTTPVGDYVSEAPPEITGVSATKATPRHTVDYGLKLLFIGFIGTLFGGLYQQVAGQIKDAIANLRLSPEYAAGLGPIMLRPLRDLIDANADGDDKVFEHALLALGSIAERYPSAHPMMLQLFEQGLKNEVGVTVTHKDEAALRRLKAAAEVLCRIGSVEGIVAVRDKASLANGAFAAKRKLARVLADTLKPTHALKELDILAKRQPTPGMTAEIERLKREVNELVERPTPMPLAAE